MSVIYRSFGGLESTYPSAIYSATLYVFRVHERKLLWLFGTQPKKYTEKLSYITIELGCCTEVTLAVSSVWKTTHSTSKTLQTSW